MKNNEQFIELTDSQMGIYLECIDNPNNLKYNIIVEYVFPIEKIDRDRLLNAYYQVVKNHQSFHIAIVEKKGSPFMTNIEGESKVDFYNIKEGNYKSFVDSFITPFNFNGDYLYHTALVSTEENLHLIINIHHIIYDGSSNEIFGKQLKRAYFNEKLEKEDGTLVTQSKLECEMEKSGSLKDCYDFYENYLGDFEGNTGFIQDKNEKALDDNKTITEKTTDFSCNEILNFAKSICVNENTLFMSAFAYTFSKFTMQNDVVFTTVDNGRFNREDLKNSMGMFVRTIPVRIKIDEDSNVKDFLCGVKENFVSSLKHDRASFIKLANKYSVNTLVSYAFQGSFLEDTDFGDISYKCNLIESKHTIDDFNLMIFKVKNRYRLVCLSRSSLFSKEQVESILDTICNIVKEFCVREKLCQVKLVGDYSSLNKFNKTEKVYDNKYNVIEKIEKNFEIFSNKTAIYYKDSSYSYAEFDKISKKIAKYVSKRICKNEFVAVLMDRKPYFVFSATGILFAGAGYQPLDPAYPKDRLNFMVKDANVKLVICDRDKRNLIDEYNGEILYTDEIDGLENCDKVNITTDLQDNFVILYTSGTTGVPKGCMLSHENILSFVVQHIEKMGLDNNSNVAQYASFGFDASVMDIFSTLMCGATLYIIPDEMRLDLLNVEKFYIDNKITHGMMTTQVGCMFLSQTKCKTLKTFGFGGEKMIPIKPPSWIKAYNLYGPTESTVYITSYQIKDDGIIQPIGRANNNTKLYIIDKYNRRMPTYCCGELLVAGKQVGKGYLNRPEKTSEVFIENIFDSDKDYNRVYKTGDIVRYLNSGDVDYIGRRDGQVKIRGFRIELAEVEQVIRSFSGIDNVTVQAFDDASGGKFICAYIVSASTIDVEELNEYISTQKPAYMVPAVTMQIDKIPLNVNGKVDKKKLPKPQQKIEEKTPPKTDIEKKIFEVVSKILGTTEFGVNTDLFSMGLSSISSIRLNVALEETFNVPIQMRDLKKLRNIFNLANLIENGKTNNKNIKENIIEDCPLTKTQEGIFVECMSKIDSIIYNIPRLFKIDNSIDIDRLKSAIVNAVEMHSYMNITLFNDANGVVRQKRPSSYSFNREDIKEISCSNINDAIKDLVKPFNLLKDRLFRISIIKEKENYLFMDFHHIISDGTSCNILLGDIEKAYLGEKLSKENYTGFDRAIDELNERNSTFFDDAKNYYYNLLDGLDTDFLPNGDVQSISKRGSGLLEYYGKENSAKNILTFVQNKNISANALLCSIFGYVLSLYNGSEYSIFTTVYNGRSDARLQNTFSMLVKTLPVVCKIDNNISEYVKKISDELLDNMTNDIYSFAEISHDFGIKNDVMFIYQGDGFVINSFCGKKASEVDLSLIQQKAPFVVQASINNDRIKFNVEYDYNKYTNDFVLEFIKTFDRIINEFCTKQTINDISLVDDEELTILNQFNNTTVPYDDTKNVVELFNEIVKNYPNNKAVFYEGKTFTYLEFDKLTNKLANYLLSKGVKKDEFVSILVGRNEFMAISAWGVVKAGAGYQPLDATYPKDRLNFMVKDSKAKLLIVDRNLRGLLSEYSGEVIYTDEIENLSTSDSAVDCNISPNNALIIIYTSGTTGTPKGCVLEHKNIVCFFHNHQTIIGIDNTSRVAQYASFGFDAGVMDIFSTLMCGATLYIIPDNIRLDISLMDRYFLDNKITHSFMTTQVGRMFAMQTKCKTLKCILMGGEKLVPFMPSRDFKAINGYGPSETIAYVTHYELVDDSKVQPIGVVHNNTKLYIVDNNFRRLPIGACGELCIAGNQVGRGYFNRPEKTNEVFIKNPFDNQKGYEKLYRTGDIVRLLPDGNYDFVGRRDGQVKIRGFRVELTEVEQIIRSFNGIDNATVQAFDDNAGGKFICAYIVSKEKIDIDKLNEFILKDKPPYMVPAVTMQIDEIPLNVNGKVDKRKLPIPKRTEKVGLEPTTKIERKICEIFGSVLGLSKVYADDNFFDIGGTSILALQLVLKLDNEGYNVVYKNIFENSTPKQLAEFIAGEVESKDYFAPSGDEKKKHNYSPLDYNIIDNVDKITTNDLGDVLLTGVTGFLGSHVFIDLLDNTKSKIICIIRDKKGFTALERLKTIVEFYFERTLTEKELERIVVITADLSDSMLEEKLKDYHIDTILNCAANVKHFGDEKELMKDNATNVGTLINLAKKYNAMLVHASSLSVSGESVDGHIAKDFIFNETNLNIGQSLENLYVRSKYLAEQMIVDEISNGLKAKIIRFGNLMGRSPDGEFQINADGNGFLRLIKGYAILGYYPVEQLDESIEFSPIDCSARAMIILAGTPKEFTCFHANNSHSIHYANIFEALNKIGFNIKFVKKDEFERHYRELMESKDKSKDFSGLLAYKNNSAKGGRKTERVKIPQTNVYTTKALYRLGFSWPIPDLTYLETLLELQKENGFFDI